MLKLKEMEIVNRALDCYAHTINEDFDKLRQTGELTKSKYAIVAFPKHLIVRSYRCLIDDLIGGYAGLEAKGLRRWGDAPQNHPPKVVASSASKFKTLREEN